MFNSRRLRFLVIFVNLAFLASQFPTYGAEKSFEIQIVDDATDRGIPLVSLTSVSDVQFVSDSAGRVCISDPAWFGKSVFFHMSSHGYSVPKDGFGYAGSKIKVEAGEKTTIRLKRTNIAERLYRTTGEGIYRDTFLLGHFTPIAEPLLNAQVTGQDSVQAAVYQGRLFWFWGDTDRAEYPLGQFWTAAAVSPLPKNGGLNPNIGVNLSYFVNAEGFSRPVCRLGIKEGVVWVDGVTTVRDNQGRQRLICHYANMKTLGEQLEHGLAIFNDKTGEFEKHSILPPSEKWRHPHGHATYGRPGETDYIYFGYAFPNVRVKANLEALLDPSQYEAWSYATDTEKGVARTASGKLNHRWSRKRDPMCIKTESRLLKSKIIQKDEPRFLPVDSDTGKRITMHRGSVRWNPHRNRWILIANQEGGSSYLGEVWYSEATQLTGPWLKTRKIVTHDRYSFYNPVHHSFFDQEDGRFIYFEGTYSATFSGNSTKTPRYDYNQIMYRLDLKNERLRSVQE